MPQPKQLSFIANARLKDVVGRDLINDDNVAIIELIKNAKDAGSKRVSLHFASFPDKNAPLCMLVQDSGKGMTEEDIRFKWLNIAYSEKKGTAPSATTSYAGNKGIGRFSCDRLGENLVLYTKAKGGVLLRLFIDWTKFEIDDQKKEIGKIKTELEEIDEARLKEETGLKGFASGTVLRIIGLRAEWTKDKLLRLKKQLEKFVIDPQKTFEVSLKVDPYREEKELNGVIENKIFEKLVLRQF